MLYAQIAAAALPALLIIFSYFVRHSKTYKILAILRAVLTFIGISAAVVMPIVLSSIIKKAAATDEIASWALDAYFLFFKYALIFTVIIAVMTSASAAIRAKMKPVRDWCTAVAAIILQIGAYAYAYISKNNHVAVDLYIYATAVAISGILYASGIFDSIALAKDARTDETIERLRRAKAKKRRRDK